MEEIDHAKVSQEPRVSYTEAGRLREAKKRTGGSYYKAADPLDQRFFLNKKGPRRWRREPFICLKNKVGTQYDDRQRNKRPNEKNQDEVKESHRDFGTEQKTADFGHVD